MITQAIRAKYTGGVLKFLENIGLHEGQEVTVRIQPSDLQTDLWLESTAQDLADRLKDLESDVPKAKLLKWHKAMERSSRAARYIPGEGIVLT